MSLVLYILLQIIDYKFTNDWKKMKKKKEKKKERKRRGIMWQIDRFKIARRK